MMSRNSSENFNNDRSSSSNSSSSGHTLTARSPITIISDCIVERSPPGVTTIRSNNSNSTANSTKHYFNRNLLFNNLWENSRERDHTIYENICQGCRYGIFDADGKFCQFCQCVLNGQFQNATDPENIYENICGECGQIYETDGCEHCRSANEGHFAGSSRPLSRSQRLKRTLTSATAGNRIFSELFGTLKKARSRNKSLSSVSKSSSSTSSSSSPLLTNKHRKLEIIHNVNAGYGNGRETKSATDLIQQQQQQQQQSYNRWDRSDGARRIYGKLRKSDDQLMNGLNIDRKSDANCEQGKNSNSTASCCNSGNSKSDSNIHSSSLFYVSCHDYDDVDFGLDKTLCDNKASKKTTTPTSSKSSPQSRSLFMVPDNVVDWLRTLHRQTVDYAPQSHYLDDSISCVKTIPSVNFNNCCGLYYDYPPFASCANAYLNESIVINRNSLNEFDDAATAAIVQNNKRADDSLRSLLIATSQHRIQLMIDNFKRNLMEKRSKRRAIYVKVDDVIAGDEEDISDDGIVRTKTVAVDPVTSAAAAAAVVFIDRANSKRNAVHERNSEFVNDILTAFDSFLGRESINVADTTKSHSASDSDGSITVRVPETHSDCNSVEISPVVASLLVAHKPFVKRSEFKRVILKALLKNPNVFIKRCDLRNFLTTVELSKGLNRNLISFEPVLGAFLSALDQLSLWNLNRNKLIGMYALITQQADKPYRIAEDSGANRSAAGGNNSVAAYPALRRADAEDIYQPIWKFRTIGNPRESYLSEDIPTSAADLTAIVPATCTTLAAICDDNDSSSLNIDDLNEWETDDEFTFSSEHSSGNQQQQQQQHQPSPINHRQQQTSNKNIRLHVTNETNSSKNDDDDNNKDDNASLQSGGESVSLKTQSSSYRSLNSNCSSDGRDDSANNAKQTYQSVCILYSLNDPKLRAIIYNYDSRKSYFTSHRRENWPQRISSDRAVSKLSPKRFRKESASSLSPRSRVRGPQRLKSRFTPSPVLGTSKNSSLRPISLSFSAPPTPPPRIRNANSSRKNSVPHDFIPLCVQAWKYNLLDINALDDEEDMHVSRDEILNSYREIESPPPPSTLKKCASEGNLLQIPTGKKKSLGERFIDKFQAVAYRSPRQMKEKKKLDYIKRRGSMGILSNTPNRLPIFDTTLEQVQRQSDSSNIPQFVFDCIELIERPENIITDGLYRASGNKVDIDIAKKTLTERYDAKLFETQDIHTITGLLKLFFRELKTALITDDVYNKLPENLVDKENLLSIREVLYLLPPVSSDTLKFLIKHLTLVASQSHTNRMPASNLAIIWGPCILHSSFTNPMSIARINTLTKVLIEHYDVIFNDKDERLIM